jgi:hypothetical protein
MDDLMIRMMQLGQQGYSCSQILILLGLESRSGDNPDLVRTMAGLAYGCGSGGATCGALTGGCCLLAYMAADGDDAAKPSAELPDMLQTLSDWFARRAGQAHDGISCEAIVGEVGPAASRQTCGALVMETYGKVMEILTEYGNLKPINS